MHLHCLLVTVLFVAAACKREALAPATSSQERASSSTSSNPPHAREPSNDISPLVERLAWEARHRPKQSITAERVFEAFDRAGLAVAGRRQYLGLAVRASYCAGGVTSEGVAISVCEYPSREAAADGKGFMDQRFAAMTPRARRIVHGQTLLTIAQPARGVGADIATRAAQTFTSLQSNQQQEYDDATKN